MSLERFLTAIKNLGRLISSKFGRIYSQTCKPNAIELLYHTANNNTLIGVPRLLCLDWQEKSLKKTLAITC